MKKIIDLKKKEQRIASSKIREKIKLKNNYDDSKLFQKISKYSSFLDLTPAIKNFKICSRNCN